MHRFLYRSGYGIDIAFVSCTSAGVPQPFHSHLLW